MPPQDSALGMYDLGSVTIADFLVNESGMNQSLTLQRGKPLPNKHIRKDGTPVGVSLTSLKPPRPSLNLSGTLHLEQKVGRGKFGYVYNARLDKDGGLSSKDIPPLVVKICIPKKFYKTEREAYYYEEMETLQGSVIPRYYGHFMAVVDPGNSVKVWTREMRWRREPGRKIEYNEVSYKSDDEDHVDYPRVVTILLLERYTVPKLTPELTETLRKEAKWMYEEIAAVGIEQHDVRPDNVVQANETYLPTLPSPKNKKMFQWRIIDFGIAQKSERPYATLKEVYAEFLEKWS
ncbi:hypothetical protein QCA50_006602 [Cerrena zonata]|uniref:Protein kinase domain-containing protein n=1 Tax=Cerrena zonata TaxID=2478898 RepID=A0AAW0GC05_9APHY